MVDDLPTVWQAQAHTLAKHEILKKYLEAWMPIVTHQVAARPREAPYILYVDGFAGPGLYKKGEPGSPIVALKAALKHTQRFPIPVRFLFIEQNEERLDSLNRVLANYHDQVDGSKNVELEEPCLGDCAEVLNRRLDACEREGTQFGPAFVFLDQFGYSSVPMSLVRRIMRYRMCEVFLYLHWRDMNRFIRDENKWAAFTATFGGEEWRDALSMSGADRPGYLLRTYKNNLRSRAGVEFSCHFSMRDKTESLLHWLFFCSNHVRGLEEMKKSMWDVDTTGTFQFSDAESPGQLRLLSGYDQSWLAGELRARLREKTLTVPEVERYVLTETPCRLYNSALTQLERDGSLEITDAPRGRRKGSFRKYAKTAEGQFMKLRFR